MSNFWVWLALTTAMIAGMLAAYDQRWALPVATEPPHLGEPYYLTGGYAYYAEPTWPAILPPTDTPPPEAYP
jgi:hypothetical protein